MMNRANNTAPIGRTTRMVVGVFGGLAALAGAEHGLGEILQGPVRPETLLIKSWPEHEAFTSLNGEPALTVIPNLMLSGIITTVISVFFAAWAFTRVHKKQGALVLARVSMVWLVVGGGFGPPFLGLILALGAIRLKVPEHPPGTTTRWVSQLWPWFTALGALGYLGLMPGTLIMHAAGNALPDVVVYGLIVLAFVSLLVAVVTARARDRIRLWHAA